MPDFPQVSHVVITVSDLSRSVPWYQRLIGSDPVLDEDTGPFRHVVFALGDVLLSLQGSTKEPLVVIGSTNAGSGWTTSPSAARTAMNWPSGKRDSTNSASSTEAYSH